MTEKLCKNCKHYFFSDWPKGDEHEFEGSCALMLDANTVKTAVDKVTGWDYEGYKAGTNVGPEFGCIHWKQKK